MGNEGIRGLEDRGGRAIILLQPHQARCREIPLEPAHILNTGPSPTVDRLIIIAYRKQAAARPDKLPEPGILERVGILKLIH